MQHHRLDLRPSRIAHCALQLLPAEKKPKKQS
jgi:hypothetical protein